MAMGEELAWGKNGIGNYDLRRWTGLLNGGLLVNWVMWFEVEMVKVIARLGIHVGCGRKEAKLARTPGCTCGPVPSCSTIAFDAANKLGARGARPDN